MDALFGPLPAATEGREHNGLGPWSECCGGGGHGGGSGGVGLTTA